MSGIEKVPSLSSMMQRTTQALQNCQKSMNANVNTTEGLNADQAERLLKLMENLVDTKIQLTNEITQNRVNYIDPVILSEMEIAIALAITDPIDAKVNQIYFSIFGYNSALWKVLRDMQKLLQTAEFLKDPRGKKVAKVEKSPRTKRKRRQEKDTIAPVEKEE